MTLASLCAGISTETRGASSGIGNDGSAFSDRSFRNVNVITTWREIHISRRNTEMPSST